MEDWFGRSKGHTNEEKVLKNLIDGKGKNYMPFQKGIKSMINFYYKAEFKQIIYVFTS